MAEATKIATDQPDGPQAAEAYFLIGRMHQSTDRFADAIAAYEEVLKRQARPVVATLSLASVYLAQAEFDRATTYAQQALTLVPDLPDARALLVRIAIGRGDMVQARQGLASLRKEYPNSPTVLNLLAAQQAADRQYDAARTTYSRSASMMPNDLEALAGLVQVDIVSGRTAQAIERLEAAMKRGTPSAALLTLAARAYASAGNMDRAETVLKEAITAEPARLQAYSMLATLYITQRRIGDAKAQFERLIALNPRSVGHLTMLGMLLDFEQKSDEAVVQYQKALAVDANAPVAANNLAWIYVSTNRNLDQALDLARTAQRGLPDEPNVNDTLGWIYYKRDLNTDAIRHLELAAKNGPDDPGTHYHLGMAYLKGGDTQKARASLQRALSLNAAFDGAAEAKQALAGIGG
jgi:tetratricopeptide (TPR) repeat protein